MVAEADVDHNDGGCQSPEHLRPDQRAGVGLLGRPSEHDDARSIDSTTIAKDAGSASEVQELHELKVWLAEHAERRDRAINKGRPKKTRHRKRK